MNRWHARRATRARPATGFTSQPEPRTIGGYARGKQLVAGNFLFAGHLVQAAPGTSLWELTPPTPAFEAALHGFGWIDDLAALGDRQARARAQYWTLDWIERYGRGNGPGWVPDLAGRRLIRWISHALLILTGAEKNESEAFFRLLGQQSIFLSRRWQATSPGLPRFEALTGLIYAGLALEGMGDYVGKATRALAKECDAQIDEDGGIPTRNPEELLEVFTLLNWASLALVEAGHSPDPAHTAAIERIAPTLRALRHSDGGLARFHGGGRGIEGRLDQALAASGTRNTQPKGLAMGYARLSSGRTSVVMDAAQPPTGKASYNAHASTLAIEITSGRRPLVVNCGSGEHFGDDWAKAGRATPSHSVLGLTGMSSSRLGTPEPTVEGPRAQLVEPPSEVEARAAGNDSMNGIVAGHNGYVGSYGLTHVRRVELALDGRMVAGEDTLAAMSEAEQARFVRALEREGDRGVPFDIRFHLHPDVDATLDMGGTAVSMALRSGEIWVFRFEGRVELHLTPSVYLEKTRLKPRASKQVVLSGRAMEYATRIRWTLAKAQDTPIGTRDLVRDEPDELPD
ncbi:heparinase II/III family protein [Maritimibacter sp. DP4N28-5]|uniref:Heparinase II/III family protein n=1 Tax=Maritimibacter dapengensis TaxID=2836868 RepID=A0ABS6SWL0_9RHOB|nr:heparinase II/III family protein [Maritimibacter dapengensis]MBV7377338.1 heparinase II/III family protein [Maritimibacter dapengensis]